ncbi:MAG: efflux RND transporter permease subunit, partial [Alphaproteobacteria bacterium]|nr:efflux RND transporter permease subunit [Alphaproteobacteria bacterium]
MLAHFFIRRPVLAFVISIFVSLAGMAAVQVLPVAQYPEIAPPAVEVRVVYPGASAEVIEQTVAAPIENAIYGVEGLMYMSSTSTSNGAATINVTFEIGTDADQAALNVNNRIKRIEARLPLEVRRQGVIVEKGSSSFLQVAAFYSPDGTFDDFYTSNYVTLNVLDRLKRIPGTTNVQIFGPKDYAMWIWLNPDRMAQLGVTVYDVGAALNEQNAQYAAGKIGRTPIDEGQALVYTVTAQGRLSSPAEFEDVIIRSNPDGSSLRLRDVARVELGPQNYDFVGRVNGKPATLVGVFLQPGANALKVGEEVKTVLKELSAAFPKGLEYKIPYDTTRFVEVSIREVLKTLLEAMVLVFLVVLVFLHNFRATLIPTLAVPVSLLGTFAGLHILGYSINTLTLFGMVLSIGIVVDDAIVVLENIERIMVEQKKTVKEAAFQAMTEVSGPVIAMTLALCAVFVPIAFLGGLAGELYRQFAITISISVILSGVVALTMTPALCVFILKTHGRGEKGYSKWFDAFFAQLTKAYVWIVRFFLRQAFLGIVLFVVLIGVTVKLWNTVPGSLVPDEDQGYYIAAALLPEGTALSRTEAVVKRVHDSIRSNENNM